MLYKRGDEKYSLEATIDSDTPVPLCDFQRDINSNKSIVDDNEYRFLPILYSSKHVLLTLRN